MNNTTNMLVIAVNKKNQYCFLVKPAPGLRRTDLLSAAQKEIITNMYFVSNHHVIIKTKTGFSTCFDIRGKAVSQPRDVQEQILNSDYEVVSKKIVSYTTDANFNRENSIFGLYDRAKTINLNGARLKKYTSILVVYEFQHET